ncbi:MAG: acetyl-CoA hydrolase/transferase family protein [Planctomycetota bacterium]
MNDWRSHAVSPEEVVGTILSGSRVFLHGTSATPIPLVEALYQRGDVEGLELYALHLEGLEHLDPAGWEGKALPIALFAGAYQRGLIESGRGDFIPVFLSDIPNLFRRRVLDLDVALLQVSPPDKHGNCTLGTSVDAAMAAATSARVVLAEINERMPRTHGDTSIPFERIDAFCITNRPLPQRPPPPETEVEASIGATIAGLIDDGSVVQAGIGAIPHAVLARRHDKLELGIHTEMFSDGVVDLYESGAITNRTKTIYPDRLVTSFVAGTDRTFDFVDDNPRVEFLPCDQTNDVRRLAKLEKLVAINSALAVDLSGQVCADSIGHRIYSGIGGQMDFVQGASISRGGKAILALPSTAKRGQVSRITTELRGGSGVVTTRGHVRWIVTEYGAANLHGKTLRQRAEALIRLAHPDFRAELSREFAGLRHFAVALAE